MTSTPPQHYDIEDIKARVDIFELLQRRGIETKGSKPILSPIRDERTPSFSIYQDGKRWKDFGSDEGGDVIDLEQVLCGVDKKEAIRSLAEMAGISPVTYGRDVEGSPISRLPKPVRRKDRSHDAEQESPLVSIEKLRSLRVNLRNLLLSDKDMRMNRNARHSLEWVKEGDLTPLLRKGWLGANELGHLCYLMRRGVKTRTSPGSSRGDRWTLGKARHNLFTSFRDDEDIHNPDKQTLILTEGESDAMVATTWWGDQAKIAGCLSCSIIPPKEMLYPLLRGIKKVIVVFDGDQAGITGSKKTALAIRSMLEGMGNSSALVSAMNAPRGQDLKDMYLRDLKPTVII
jgi:hypothetical protein|tara:strand:- start:16572 stop:17606 length:1035 start_codon:yes stop_codon:yes gene_type:complete